MQTCPYQCIVLYLSQGRSQLVVAHADKGEKSVMWRDHAVRDVKKMAMNAWDTITVKSAPAFVSGGTAEVSLQCYSLEFPSPSYTPLYGPEAFGSRIGAPDISNGVARDVRCLYSGIPPSVDASRAMRDEYLAQVANELVYGKPAEWTYKNTTGCTLWGKTSSRTERGYPIIETYIGWIDRYEDSLTRESSSRPSLSETRDCLMSHLKLATFKSTLVDSTAGYVLLQRAYPKFLLVVATDSDLLVEQPNGSLVISFSRVISAPWDAVVWFAMYDTVSAFLLGTIPLAEYGYNCEGGSEQHRFEWIYGIPVAMLQVIAQVNSRRAGSRVALDDWQTLERRVMDWKVSFSMIKIGRSADSVDKERARADSKEAARAFAVCHPMMREYKLPLIYASQPIHRFTSAQAGLAARQEKQRIAVYEKLISFKDTRVWLYCGQQFSEFLYSLWHGVGIGGAAVTWGDYVRSRRTIVPI
ncbi:hypothetical protein RHS01_07571 [Rhizoctonia solani]|uniref:Uncharacterized protein n=1 Tax=Rhizoctonia solani TaxID=456999 RepID=A0A8H7M2V9_9AGAM|nr:hypothetical protein RHS01_07571 [Rhizoctonia solani]